MRSDSVGLAKQIDLGTMQTTMEYFVPVESAEPTFNRELIEADETVGHRFPVDPDYGVRFWEVSLSGNARLDSLPRLLSAYLGEPTTSGEDPYTHLFDPAAAGKELVPHSILVNRDDPDPSITDLFYGALGGDFSLNVEPNAYLAFEAALTAIGLDDSQGEPVVTADVSKRFPFHTVTAHISIDGGAETEIAVASFGFSFSNNVDTDEAVLGQRELYTLSEGNMNAEVTFSPREALSEHYRRAMLDNPEDVAIRLLAASGTDEVELIVPRCHYLEAPAPVSASDKLKQVDVTARVAYDPASSEFFTVGVTNGVVSY